MSFPAFPPSAQPFGNCLCGYPLSLSPTGQSVCRKCRGDLDQPMQSSLVSQAPISSAAVDSLPELEAKEDVSRTMLDSDQLRERRSLESIWRRIEPEFVCSLNEQQVLWLFNPPLKPEATEDLSRPFDLSDQILEDSTRGSLSSAYFNGKVMRRCEWGGIPFTRAECEGVYSKELKEEGAKKIKKLVQANPLHQHLLVNLCQGGIQSFISILLQSPALISADISSTNFQLRRDSKSNSYYCDMRCIGQTEVAEELYCVAYDTREVFLKEDGEILEDAPSFELQARIHYSVIKHENSPQGFYIKNPMLILGVTKDEQPIQQGDRRFPHLTFLRDYIRTYVISKEAKSVMYQRMLAEGIAHHLEQERRYSGLVRHSFYAQEHLKVLAFFLRQNQAILTENIALAPVASAAAVVPPVLQNSFGNLIADARNALERGVSPQIGLEPLTLRLQENKFQFQEVRCLFCGYVSIFIPSADQSLRCSNCGEAHIENNQPELKYRRNLESMRQPIVPLFILLVEPRWKMINPCTRGNETLMDELFRDVQRYALSSIYYNRKILRDSAWKENIPFSAQDCFPQGVLQANVTDNITALNTHPLKKHITHNMDQGGVSGFLVVLFESLVHTPGQFIVDCERKKNKHYWEIRQKADNELHCIAYCAANIHPEERPDSGIPRQRQLAGGGSENDMRDVFELQARLEYTVVVKNNKPEIRFPLLTLGIAKNNQPIVDPTQFPQWSAFYKYMNEHIMGVHSQSALYQNLIAEHITYHLEQDRRYADVVQSPFYAEQHLKALQFWRKENQARLNTQISPAVQPALEPLILQTDQQLQSNVPVNLGLENLTLFLRQNLRKSFSVEDFRAARSGFSIVNSGKVPTLLSLDEEFFRDTFMVFRSQGFYLASEPDPCHLLLLATDPERNFRQLPVESAYIRYQQSLFYMDKSTNECILLVQDNVRILNQFDLEMRVNTLVLKQPRKLTQQELRKIVSITGHIRHGEEWDLAQEVEAPESPPILDQDRKMILEDFFKNFSSQPNAYPDFIIAKIIPNHKVQVKFKEEACHWNSTYDPQRKVLRCTMSAHSDDIAQPSGAPFHIKNLANKWNLSLRFDWIFSVDDRRQIKAKLTLLTLNTENILLEYFFKDYFHDLILSDNNEKNLQNLMAFFEFDLTCTALDNQYRVNAALAYVRFFLKSLRNYSQFTFNNPFIGHLQAYFECLQVIEAMQNKWNVQLEAQTIEIFRNFRDRMLELLKQNALPFLLNAESMQKEMVAHNQVAASFHRSRNRVYSSAGVELPTLSPPAAIPPMPNVSTKRSSLMNPFPLASSAVPTSAQTRWDEVIVAHARILGAEIQLKNRFELNEEISSSKIPFLKNWIVKRGLPYTDEELIKELNEAHKEYATLGGLFQEDCRAFHNRLGGSLLERCPCCQKTNIEYLTHEKSSYPSNYPCPSPRVFTLGDYADALKLRSASRQVLPVMAASPPAAVNSHINRSHPAASSYPSQLALQQAADCRRFHSSTQPRDSQGRPALCRVCGKTDEGQFLSGTNMQQGVPAPPSAAMLAPVSVLPVSSSMVATYLAEGKIKLNQGRYKEARVCFEKILTLSPNLAEAHYGLGVIQERQGDYAKANLHYEDARKLNPDYAEAHYGLGFVKMKQGCHEEARAYFEKALALKPELVEAHFSLAILKYNARYYQAALEHMDRAIGLGYQDTNNLRQQIEDALRIKSESNLRSSACERFHHFSSWLSGNALGSDPCPVCKLPANHYFEPHYLF
jgi:tetratricopeptide (TPR) repeat protein/ribosomal protein S27E